MDQESKFRHSLVEEADKAVGAVLGALGDAGHVETERLSENERQEYVKKVCALAAMALATMPCVQKAMGIKYPTVDARDRYAMVLAAVVRCFGFEPEKEDAPNYFRPANPSMN